MQKLVARDGMHPEDNQVGGAPVLQIARATIAGHMHRLLAVRADDLRRQAAAYEPLTSKPVLAAYHLVAVVAQRTAGGDGMWRRRESPGVIRELLEEARGEGFLLVLDIQPGRSPIGEELEYLRPFLSEPDVHLALDPEFDMSEGQVPGRELGHMHAAEVNTALAFLEDLVATNKLPPRFSSSTSSRWG